MSAIIKNNKLLLINPVTKENIGELNICDESFFSNIEKNATTYTKWNQLSLKKRCHHINRFRKVILNNKDRIQQILINETGKK